MLRSVAAACGWLCLGLTCTPALAQASYPSPPPPAVAADRAAPAGLSPAAVALDAYITSDAVMDLVIAQMCGRPEECSGIPNIYAVIRDAEPERYAAFLENAVALVPNLRSSDFARSGAPQRVLDLAYAFMTEALGRAALNLDDEIAAAALRDTALGFREARDIYPQMCTNALLGVATAPPADMVRRLFKADRLRLNVSFLQRSAENQRRVARGDLTLPAMGQAEVMELMVGYFRTLPPERLAVMGRISSPQATEADHRAACELAADSFSHLADQPPTVAGAALRGLMRSALPQ
jgi:hypothetical protein